MPVTINGNGSITGLAQGGLDGTVVTLLHNLLDGANLQVVSKTVTVEAVAKVIDEYSNYSNTYWIMRFQYY